MIRQSSSLLIKTRRLDAMSVLIEIRCFLGATLNVVAVTGSSARRCRILGIPLEFMDKSLTRTTLDNLRVQRLEPSQHVQNTCDFIRQPRFSQRLSTLEVSSITGSPPGIILDISNQLYFS